MQRRGRSINCGPASRSASPEVGVIRTYVDWLVGLPWNVTSEDQLDIKEAARILDEDGDPVPDFQVQIASRGYVQGRKQLN